jgi:hypothetical protein
VTGRLAADSVEKRGCCEAASRLRCSINYLIGVGNTIIVNAEAITAVRQSDYYKLREVIPADQAFRPLKDSVCTLVKKGQLR